MKCSDLKELLSAYANEELNQTQKEFIEEHLAHCLDCRATLADYRVTRERLLRCGTPVITTDIREVTMSRIKSKMKRTGIVISRWLVTAVLAFLIILLLTSIPSIFHWLANDQSVSAESIVRNSTEIKTALNGEPVEVEVTTEVTDESGELLLAWGRTENKIAVAEVDLATAEVTRILSVESIPQFDSGEKDKVISIANADARIQDLLAQGAVIAGVNLVHGIDFDRIITDNNGQTISASVSFQDLGIVTLKKGLSEWSVTVDPQNGKVMGYGQNSIVDKIIAVSRTVYSFLNPLFIALGVLLLIGLLSRKRAYVKAAGFASIMLGIAGLYGSIYARFPDLGNQLLSLILPVLGLALGITDLTIRSKGRWIDIFGIVIGTCALIMQLMNFADSFQIILSIFIIVPLIVGMTSFLICTRTAHSRSWVRILSIGVTAIVIGLSLAMIRPWTSSDSQDILAKAYSNTQAILSYRSTTNPFIRFENPDGVVNTDREINAEWEFVLPDRIHLNVQYSNTMSEYIFIGDSIYYQENKTFTIVFPEGFYSAIPVPSKEKTLAELNSLLYSAELPDEFFEGIECYHYEGAFQEVGQTIKVEYWISKKDYLIRQIKRTYEDGSSSHTRYYDFNEPITIEAPVDASGKPLPGWLVVSDDFSSYLDPSLFPQTTTTQEYNPNPTTTTTGFR